MGIEMEEEDYHSLYCLFFHTFKKHIIDNYIARSLSNLFKYKTPEKSSLKN